MIIDRIIVGCNKRDFHLAKICIASIRYWCPKTSIELLIDELNGPVNTRDLENHFNVTLYNAPISKMGWGVNTLLPITDKSGKRTLFLDADIVLLGDIVSYLEPFDEDVIVSIDKPPSLLELMELSYFNKKNIKAFDPNYKLPKYLFNCGQLVFNDGLLSKNDFNGMVNWDTSPPKLLNKETFICADQSMLNYHVSRLEQKNEISVKQLDFSIWGYDTNSMNNISIEKLKIGEGIPKIIHWSGKKSHIIAKMSRADILEYYGDIYYSTVKNGSLKRVISRFTEYKNHFIFSLKKQIVMLRNKLR